jgi:general secretion pathway protein G
MNHALRRFLSTSTLLLLPLLVAAVLSAGCDCVPFRTQHLRAREAVLRTNLHILRDALDQYRHDKGHAPASLQALVDEGYLRQIPVDSFTRRRDTWIPVYEPTSKGVVGVHSGARGRGLDGRSYREW